MSPLLNCLCYADFMKVVILYRPASEYSRSVEEYTTDFERARAKKIELISLDTREGADMAELYGITTYPAMLAIREDGQLMKDWQGPQMPLMNEVAAYID
jgi:hypothetical protein